MNRDRTRRLLRPIGSTLPTAHPAILIEMNRQDSKLGKRAVEGNKLLRFSEDVYPGFSGFTRLEYLVWLIVLSYNLSLRFAAKRRDGFIV